MFMYAMTKTTLQILVVSYIHSCRSFGFQTKHHSVLRPAFSVPMMVDFCPLRKLMIHSSMRLGKLEVL